MTTEWTQCSDTLSIGLLSLSGHASITIPVLKTTVITAILGPASMTVPVLKTTVNIVSTGLIIFPWPVCTFVSVQDYLSLLYYFDQANGLQYLLPFISLSVIF